jgi:transposase-like protein
MTHPHHPPRPALEPRRVQLPRKIFRREVPAERPKSDVPAGRPPKLTPELVDRLAERIATGEPLGAAARSVGASPRSLRRWRQSGREQLHGLGLEARLELALERAERERPESWEEAAARLVMNEAAYRELLAEIAADDPLADF